MENRCAQKRLRSHEQKTVWLVKPCVSIGALLFHDANADNQLAQNTRPPSSSLRTI
jgi:hypothetical protein